MDDLQTSFSDDTVLDEPEISWRNMCINCCGLGIIYSDDEYGVKDGTTTCDDCCGLGNID